MTQKQRDFLNNLTAESAKALLAKFGDDPESAARKSEAAYVAFCRAWEFLNPGEYWQRRHMAGRVEFSLVCVD